MPIWADDISLAVMHESLATMLQVIPEVANSVLHVLATAGLTPNMSKGKTELFIELRGKGAVNARRHLTRSDNLLAMSSMLLPEPLSSTTAGLPGARRPTTTTARTASFISTPSPTTRTPTHRSTSQPTHHCHPADCAPRGCCSGYQYACRPRALRQTCHSRCFTRQRLLSAAKNLPSS